MTNETHRLRAQAAILRDVAQDYPGRTIENTIAARLGERFNVTRT